MALHYGSNAVVFILLLLAKFAFSLESGQTKEYCSPATISPPIHDKVRPDPSLEEVLFNQEVITGKTCFSIDVRPHRSRNSAHVTVLRHDELDVCKGFIVKGVEIMALGYLKNGKRQDRLPFGNMRREQNGTVVEETCGYNGQDLDVPVDDMHVVYSPSPTEWQDCVKQSGFLFPTSDSANSIRIFSDAGLGKSGSGTIVVACAIWSYTGANYTYPASVSTTVPIYMEFIAELDIQNPGRGSIFRSVAKMSRLHEPVIKRMPQLLCKYKIVPPTNKPITTLPMTCPPTIKPNYCGNGTGRYPNRTDCTKYYTCNIKDDPDPVSAACGPPGSGKYYNETARACDNGTCINVPITTDRPCVESTTPTTTKPVPMYVTLPCESHDKCSTVKRYLVEPKEDFFSSTYRSVSDICKCHPSWNKIKFTLRKYHYGGFHYGLPVPAQPNTSVIIPATPVKDVIFQDCLQFYFNTSNTCAVFTVDPCHADPTVVTDLTLYEFYIFALATTSPNATNDAKPFGEWELVENSLGNCGDLVNSKAMKLRGQMWTTRYENEVCSPNPLGLHKDLDFGMPQYKTPKVWRVQLDNPLVLQGSGANASKVYAIRFNADTQDFDYSNVPLRPEYISFGLEAYTKIKTKYDSTEKWQIISLKTPIVHVEYVKYHTKLKITPTISTTHQLKYLQLNETWDDKLHFGASNACTKYQFPSVVAPKTVPTDKGLENTCRCFSPLRPTGMGDGNPTTAQKFFDDVKVHAGGTPITEKCFIFGFEAESPKPIMNPSGACNGQSPQQRVLVYFGLTCAGPQAVEVMDMTIQAQNHKGYPVGYWTQVSQKEQELECHKKLKSSASSKEWIIRDVRPISTFTCADTKYPNDKTFLHADVPVILFFNNNLTAEATNDGSYFGYCAWWNYKHTNRHTDNPKNFYFDFQFVATTLIGHRSSKTRYLVTFRTERGGYDVTKCETHTLSKDLRQQDIFINEDYYRNEVETAQTCIQPLNLIDNFAMGLCGCWAGQPVGKPTHRISSDVPETNPIHEYINTFQQCMNLNAAIANRPQSWSLVASFSIEDSQECNDFRLFELVLEVLNNHGVPMGTWDTQLVQGGPLCEKAKLKGSATVDVFKCPKNTNPVILDLYKTDADNINVFHFKNRWMDDDFNALCARWFYPKSYADKHKNDLPLDFQFYAQTHVMYIPNNTLITAPKFTVKKVKFQDNGNFNQLLDIKPFQHPKDYNNYLIKGFHSTLNGDCLIKYPKPPDYASYSCRMFHPSDLQDTHQLRIDLYNTDPDNTEGAIYRNRKCYTFTAYPGNQALSMHLTFRQDLSRPTECGAAVHFALTAFNEKGFPVGSIEHKSFSYYDNPGSTDDPRYCSYEDITVESDSIDSKDFEACPFHPNPASGLDKTTMEKFYLQTVSENELPGMAIVAVTPEKAPEGICFHWVYDEQPNGQPTPKFIQFYLEIFVPLSKENTVIGNVFLLRSSKFQMNYKAGAPINPPPDPAKSCHDPIDRHHIFEELQPPSDWWRLMHEYTIYPDKTAYRKCLQEYNAYKTCSGKVKDPDPIVIVNPGVVIPGSGHTDDENFNHRYNTTKVIYSGCLTTKLCFSPLQGIKDSHECILEMNCGLLWAIGKQPINPVEKRFPDPDENDEIVFEIYAATNGWVAMGISIDNRMGEDMVFECIKDSAAQSASLHYSWNIGHVGNRQTPSRHDNDRFPEGAMDGNARLIHRTADEKSVHCLFYVRSTFQMRSLDSSIIYYYDLKSKRYCILAAFGDHFKSRKGLENDSVPAIGSHMMGTRKGHATCSATTLLSTRLMPTRHQVRILQSHGALISIVFVGALSVSLFVARYYKLSLARLFYNYPLWVWIHGVIATAAGVLIFIDWVLIGVGRKGWSSPISSPFHNVIGYLSTIIIFLNVPLGYYIRKTDSLPKKHSAFYVAHGVSGHFALVAGLLIIMLSTHVEYAFLPCSTKYVSVSFFLLYFLVHIFMSYNRVLLEKILKEGEKRRTNSFVVTPFILLTQNAPSGASWYDEYPKAALVRIIILGLFAILAVGFAVGIAYKISSSDHSCALEKSLWYNVE